MTDLPKINPQNLNSTVINRHIADFRTAIRIDATDQTARYGLGVAYFNLGLLEDSARELELAAQMMPENPNIQTQLASVYETLASKGDLDYIEKAQDRIRRALQLRPEMTEALLIRAKVSLLQKQFQNAVIDWRQIAQSDEDAVRQSVGGFLSRHVNLLSNAPGIALNNTVPTRLQNMPSRRDSRSLERIRAFIRRPRNALLMSLATFILMIVAATGSADDEGTIGGLAALVFLFLFCSWIVLLIYGLWRLWKSRRESSEHKLSQDPAVPVAVGEVYTISEQRAYLESLSNGTAGCGELLGAATYVANELNRAELNVLRNIERRSAAEAQRKEALEQDKLVQAIKAANRHAER